MKVPPMKLGKYQQDLPIKASLIAFGDFHKSIDLKAGEIPQYLKIPIFKVPIACEIKSDVIQDATAQLLTFEYERHKEVRQSKGQAHIVAVYRQVE